MTSPAMSDKPKIKAEQALPRSEGRDLKLSILAGPPQSFGVL
ncbi:hypothetical protein [Deinococcus sonorensis]|uniref:Uncharacterized protein n=2 Tax=Deinococcus sonorensis TaxID=309891 RepID=A0AAU7U8Z7_9DEIO